MLTRLGFPAVGAHRRFVAALVIDAIGSGVWMPLSMLYFLHQTPLSLVQLGTSMSVANLAAIPLVPVIGQLVDRFGPKAIMQTGNLGSAIAFALYPLAHTLPVVTVLIFVASLTRSGFWGALSPMVIRITAPGERETWFGFVGALRNAGFGVGGLLASLALAVGTNAAYQSVVLLNAASYVVALVLLAGVTSGRRQPGERRKPTGGAWVAFHDGGYRWLVAVIFCYAMTEMTLNTAMPVYFVDTLRLPGWVPGVVFVINTVMIGIGQGLVVRGLVGTVRSRVLQLAVSFSASSFVLMYAAGRFSVVLAVVVVLVGAVVYTLGELVAGPIVATLAAEAAPDEMRGRYVAATQLAWGGASALAPVLLSWWLHLGGSVLWGGCLVICLLWSVLIRVLARRLPLVGRRVTRTAAEPS